MSSQIFIREETGRTRTVCVNSEELKNMTVKEFLRKFCPEEKRDGYRYFFEGKYLKDDLTLAFYGIKDHCIIYKTACLRGGGLPPPEDEDVEIPRTESMEILAPMQQTEPESSGSCWIL